MFDVFVWLFWWRLMCLFDVCVCDVFVVFETCLMCLFDVFVVGFVFIPAYPNVGGVKVRVLQMAEQRR